MVISENAASESVVRVLVLGKGYSKAMRAKRDQFTDRLGYNRCIWARGANGRMSQVRQAVSQRWAVMKAMRDAGMLFGDIAVACGYAFKSSAADQFRARK